MVVSFVNAGLLTLANAIGVIMGANIGTTLTAWITALGFSVDISVFSVPLMAGLISGTYSSLFVAPVTWSWWCAKSAKKKADAKKKK